MTKIGYLQTNPIFGEKQANFKNVIDLIGAETADLIVLPELFATGYTFTTKQEAFNLSEGINDETYNFLYELSKKTGAVIVGGFIEKQGNQIFNSAMVVSPNGFEGTYRKLHLYYKEKLWFSSGSRQLNIFEIGAMNIGVMICFDWIFPEVVRSLALKGADIIAHPANLVMPYCQKAMVTRSLENRVYSVTANRIGEEKRGVDHFKFTGKSQITSFNGDVISSAPKGKIFREFVDIDINQARNKNLNEMNNLFEDRRPHFYIK
jgi:predicted amidohydrolase